VPLPVQVEFGVSTNKVWPADYPLPTLASPMGFIYHLPGAAMCKDGAKVGDDGCTWKRSPLMHTVYVEDLLALGLNTTYIRNAQDVLLPSEASMRNIDVFRKAFEEIPVDIPPCGMELDIRVPAKSIVV
jgi:hypothetical protein